MKFLPKSITLEGALEGDRSLRIWSRHIRKHAPIYAFGIFSVVLTNIADIAIPKFIQWTIDTVAAGDPDFVPYVVAVVALLFLQFIGRIYWRRCLGQQTHFVAARMKSLLWNRARYFPRERLETNLTPGELMSVATSDVGIARFMFGFTIVGTVDFMFLLTLSMIAMLSVNVKLTLATIVVLPVVPFLVDRLSRRENTQHRVAQAALSSMTDLIAQAVATQRLQRVSQTHTFWEKKLRDSAAAYRDKKMDVVNTSLAFIPVTGIAPLISFGILLALGIRQVLAGSLTLGEFVAMQSYIFLIQTPMLELGSIVSEWQRGRASFDRLTHTLAEPEAVGLRSGGVAPAPTPGAFEVRELRFSHQGSTRELFDGLNFTLAAGRRLAVTGPIGSGKTTLLEILAGLRRNFTGDVKVFGRDVRECSHEWLRAQIAVVPQKPFLFGDTVRSNLRLDRELSDEELWRWLEVAGVREDIEALPEGLGTRLGEWGVNLSGGQKQRLTLARALARRPSILLLDDCLSAVDTVTEERILASLDRELGGATLVWVAHRASTLRYCTDFVHLGALDHGKEGHA